MFDWIVPLWNNFSDFIYRCLMSIPNMLKDTFFFLFESLMSIVGEIVAAVGGLFPETDISRFMNLPSVVLDIFSLIGIQYCLSLVVISLTIRFLLQLIPFVRLGS